MVFFQRKVIAMKIVGSHDEIIALKLACQNRSQCEHCIMHVFCQIEGNNVLDLFSIEKFKTIYIGGDSHGEER